MTRTDNDETRERLLRCGREAFARDGFERASLREICKAAGITTGPFYWRFPDKEALFAALVEPAVAAMRETYETAVRESDATAGAASGADASGEAWRYAADGASDAEMRAANLAGDLAIVRLMHERREAFDLLLNHASGTRFATFVEDMATRETEVTRGQYDAYEGQGLPVRRLSDDQVRALVRAHFACLFEPVARGCALEECLASAEVVADFFWAGWRTTVWG